MRAVECGSAGQEAVIIVRETLRLHQRVLAAGRAAGHRGLVRMMRIERIDDLLAPDRHQMDRPVAEILDPLRMPEQAGRWVGWIAERNGERIALVAVGAAEQRIAAGGAGAEIAIGGSEAGHDAVGKLGIGDGTLVTAATGAEKT